MRIIDFLDHGALLSPSAICLSSAADAPAHDYTFAQTVELSHRIGAALHRDGVHPGDAVAVLSPNNPLGYACMMGLFRAGAVWIPLNGRNPLSENQSVMRARGVTWLFYHSDYQSDVNVLMEIIGSLRGAVCIDSAPATPATPAIMLSQWMAEQGCARVEVAERADDLAAIVSTGGTTGEPKGAMLPHRVFETMVATFMTCMPIDRCPVHLVVAPMTHGAGATTFPMLAAGATQVFMAKAEPGAILQEIERRQVTHVFLPPTLLYMLLAHPDVRRRNYSSLRYLLLGAAPVAAEKLREAVDVFGPVVAQCFGQVEAPMVCTFMSPSELADAIVTHPARMLSCGRPTALVKLPIVDEQGRPVAAGERGEIVVRGNLVMHGYHSANEATPATEGWHHTGDIGIMDADAYVYIVDRKRDLIISGGFNIYPSEIEQVLLAHPCVQDGAVIGVPDEKWGEAVKAVVQLKPGEVVTPEALLTWCRERLGGMKTPKTLEIWEQLPRSPVGKVLKKVIRAQYWTQQDRCV